MDKHEEIIKLEKVVNIYVQNKHKFTYFNLNKYIRVYKKCINYLWM